MRKEVWILLFFGIIFFQFFHFVNSDILSINSGGNEELIINPENYLEGFFFQEDIAPVMSNVILYSLPSSTNTTLENLTVDYTSTDSDGDFITNISDWRVGGVSIAVLNMPFDRQISSITTGAVRDYSIFGNNGTLGGGNLSRIPTWNSSCKIGGCYDFDGTNDYIDMGDVGDMTNAVTVSAWIYQKGSHGGGYGYVVGKRDAGSADTYQMIFNGDDAYFYIDTGSGAYSIIPNIPLNEWHYIVGVYNGSRILLYYDGSLYDSDPQSGSMSNVANTLKIGGIGTNYFFNGSIDEVQIYNRALTPEQIRANYQAGLAGHSIEIIVSQETAIWDIWQVAMTANDQFLDSRTILSNNLTVKNAALEDPVPLLVSLNGRNEPDSDLNCSFDVIDFDSSFINVTVNWFKDEVSQYNFSYNNIPNATNYYSILNSGNLTLGDVWMCSVRFYDGYEYSNWGNSNELEIVDITPPNITIISPLPTNYSELNVSFNISLSENGSVCYYNLDDWGNLSMIKINNTYFWILNESLGPGEHNLTFWCNDSSNNWGMNFTNFSIENEAAIAILLSEKLSWSVLWNVTSIPADDLDANGNNLGNATDYYINVSATNTLVDIYVRADGDLHTIGLEVLGLENENYTASLTDPNVTGIAKFTMTTDYVIIADGIGDNSTVYMKFYLDVPPGQGAGMYFNNLDFKAVRHGQSP